MELIRFCNSLKKGSLFVLGHVVREEEGGFRKALTRYRTMKTQWMEFVDRWKIKAFSEIFISQSERVGARSLAMTSGLGGMKPNLVIMGWRRSGAVSGISALDYVSIITDTLSLGKSVAIARGFRGLTFPPQADIDAGLARTMLSSLERQTNAQQKPYIDLYPFRMEDDFDTYSMVLQLGCILNMVHCWSDRFYTLRVIAVVENPSDIGAETRRLAGLLTDLRINAKVLCVSIQDFMASYAARPWGSSGRGARARDHEGGGGGAGNTTRTLLIPSNPNSPSVSRSVRHMSRDTVDFTDQPLQSANPLVDGGAAAGAGLGMDDISSSSAAPGDAAPLPSFNHLPPLEQHRIINLVMRKYSRPTDTAVIMTSLPAPQEICHDDDDDDDKERVVVGEEEGEWSRRRRRRRQQRRGGRAHDGHHPNGGVDNDDDIDDDRDDDDDRDELESRLDRLGKTSQHVRFRSHLSSKDGGALPSDWGRRNEEDVHMRRQQQQPLPSPTVASTRSPASVSTRDEPPNASADVVGGGGGIGGDENATITTTTTTTTPTMTPTTTTPTQRRTGSEELTSDSCEAYLRGIDILTDGAGNFAGHGGLPPVFLVHGRGLVVTTNL